MKLWKMYVLVSKDGSDKDAFIYWDRSGSYYTTTECIDELGDLDFFDTVEAALERANEVNSSTFGGWNWASIRIMKLLNISKVYNEGEEPELLEVQVISFV